MWRRHPNGRWPKPQPIKKKNVENGRRKRNCKYLLYVQNFTGNKNLYTVLRNYAVSVGEIVMADVLKIVFRILFPNIQGLTIFNFLVQCRWTLKEITEKCSIIPNAQEHLHSDVLKQSVINIEIADLVFTRSSDIFSEGCKTKIESVVRYKSHIFRKILRERRINFKDEVLQFYELVRGIYISFQKEFDIDFAISCMNIDHIKEHYLKNKDHKIYSPMKVKTKKLIKDESPQLYIPGKLIQVKRYLALKYRRLEVMNPFEWLCDENYRRIIRYQTVRIPVRELERGRVYIKRTYMPLTSVGTDTTISVQHLLCRTRIGNQMVSPRVQLITGAEGMGKTTLCYHIAQDWYNKTEMIDSLEEVEILIVLENYMMPDQDVKQYLEDRLLRSLFLMQRQLKVVSFVKKKKVLTILDGFDDAPEKLSCVLQSVLDIFINGRVIITTREEKVVVSNVLTITKERKITLRWLRMSPMGEDEQNILTLDVYKRIRCKRTIMNAKCRQEFLQHFLKESNKWIRDVLVKPIYLALYIVQWEELRWEVKTISEIYECFYRICFNKLAFRLSFSEPDCKELWKKIIQVRLGEIAWALLKRKIRKVPDDALDNFKKFFIRLRVDHYEILLAFLSCTLDRTKYPNVMNFTFIDTMHQAFYASRYLTNILLKNSTHLYFAQKGIVWKEVPPTVLQFMIGRLAQLDAGNEAFQVVLGIIDGLGIPSNDYTFWWNLYSESRGRRCVLNYINEKGATREWVLDNTNFLPALKLFGSSPIELDSLTIDFPKSVDPHEVPLFLSAMEDLPLKVYSKCRARTTRVHLHFRNHYEEGSSRTSHGFLSTLRPWATLVSFTGELGEEEIDGAAIRHASHLRSVRVRVATPRAAAAATRLLSEVARRCEDVSIKLDMPSFGAPSSLRPVRGRRLSLVFPLLRKGNRGHVRRVSEKVLAARCDVKCLSIGKCKLDYGALRRFIVKLNNIVTMLSIGGVTFSEEKKRELAKIANFEIIWT